VSLDPSPCRLLLALRPSSPNAIIALVFQELRDSLNPGLALDAGQLRWHSGCIDALPKCFDDVVSVCSILAV